MTPLQLYQQQLTEGRIEPDNSQYQVMGYLNSIYDQLCTQQKIVTPVLHYFYRRFKSKTPIKGLYLWGNVGSGKTHLVNLFYQCIPINKARQHFHAFMQDIQQQLIFFQGTKNPLREIAKKLAGKSRLIVLDEFFVTNIADAMILAELLNGLFREGICLITTSNSMPDQLYLNGLQRENFLPAIELLKENTQVIQLQTYRDYRQNFKQIAQTYYYPLTPKTCQSLEECFSCLVLSNIPILSEQKIYLFNHALKIKRKAENIIWCNFLDICSPPRSPKDYLELIKQYKVFIISHVPKLSSASIDQVILFIYLIDILYDEHARLILSAEVPVDQLYPTGRLRQKFERTESRLIEMQSSEYFYK